jgi:NAD(P)-dependent dehydrogenase (short-subunit alcohol dehydrogenase family)
MATTYDFAGKRAVITGGASGFGRATAEKLADAGARVLVVDLDEAGAKEVADSLPGGLGRAAACDVTREADVAAYARAAVDEFGGIDFFFNNAGILGRSGSFFDVAEADFDQLFDVNVKGVFFGLRDVGRQMMAQGSGAIVNTASTAGLSGRGGPLYSTTKWAVIGLARSVARVLGPSGVRVNVVCPTATATKFGGWGRTEEEAAEFLSPQIAQIPLGRLGRPSDIASTVAWLFSEESSFVNGAVLPVDGGFTA